MKKRNAIFANLVGLGAATGFVLLTGCNDYTTGQDEEPAGPLMVTRLTLNDSSSRDIQIVTDTSAPLDCMQAPFKDSTACVNSPFKDRFSTKMSPPTPDSAGQLRVVFNKLPLKLNGADVEPVPVSGLPTMLKLIDPTIIRLECEGCGGIPPSTNTLEATGSNLSPDPTFFPYGPALQMAVTPDDDDPVLALEPDTVYHVTLNPSLSGRNPDDKVLLDDAARTLLSFRTEALKLLRLGIGNGVEDTWVYAADPMCGDGSAGNPYKVGQPAMDDCLKVSPSLYNDGAIVVNLNAGIDESAFVPGSTATATLDGAAVPVILSNSVGTPGKCTSGNKRTLYIAPMAGKWMATFNNGTPHTVSVTLKAGEIKDVSQAAGHPAGAGKHTLAGSVTLIGVLKDATTPVDQIKAGAVTAGDVVPPSDC